jgi:hypothetical protein
METLLPWADMIIIAVIGTVVLTLKWRDRK